MTTKTRLHIVAFGTLIVFLLTMFAFIIVVRADDGRDHTGVKAELIDRAEEKRTQLQERSDALREKIDEKQVELDARREEASVKAQDRIEQREQKLDEKRKERIAAYVARIVNRMNAAVTRLGKIADRVDSRIAKLEEKIDGLSLDESKVLLETAREELLNSAAGIGTIAEALLVAFDSDTPKAAFVEVRAIFGEAKQNIKDAHSALVDAIRSVKAARDLRADDSDTDSDGGGDNE